MSFEAVRGRQHGGGGGSATSASQTPGKRTLTEALVPAPVQMAPVAARNAASGPDDAADVRGAAALGTSGPTTELPHRDAIQRAFGHHDIGHVKAHVGGPAEAGATAMGAEAFATGDRVAFAASPDLRTAAHEAAHAVQQRGGVQLHGGIGEVGDVYEEHADEVADLVVRGQSAEAVLDRHAGTGGGDTGGGAVQRHAFVAGKQIKKRDPIAKGAVAAFVTDDVVRSYKTRDELRAACATPAWGPGTCIISRTARPCGPRDRTPLRAARRRAQQRYRQLVVRPRDRRPRRGQRQRGRRHAPPLAPTADE